MNQITKPCQSPRPSFILMRMTNDVMPSTAYELLPAAEQQAVDEYVGMVEVEARRRGERVAVALSKPIPPEIIRWSRGVFLKPLVKAAIVERLQHSANNQDVSPSRVIAEHAALAFSNMADYVKIGMFGEYTIDMSKCTREQMAAIKSIETTDTPQGRKVKITLYDKVPSLAALKEVMAMPLITEPIKSSQATRIAAGENPEKAFTNLLESMRA